MSDREYYISRISDMLRNISNLEWIEKIFYFVKVFADDKEGAA